MWSASHFLKVRQDNTRVWWWWCRWQSWLKRNFSVVFALLRKTQMKNMRIDALISFIVLNLTINMMVAIVLTILQLKSCIWYNIHFHFGRREVITLLAAFHLEIGPVGRDMTQLIASTSLLELVLTTTAKAATPFLFTPFVTSLSRAAAVWTKKLRCRWGWCWWWLWAWGWWKHTWRRSRASCPLMESGSGSREPQPFAYLSPA